MKYMTSLLRFSHITVLFVKQSIFEKSSSKKTNILDFFLFIYVIYKS